LKVSGIGQKQYPVIDRRRHHNQHADDDWTEYTLPRFLVNIENHCEGIKHHPNHIIFFNFEMAAAFDSDH